MHHPNSELEIQGLQLILLPLVVVAGKSARIFYIDDLVVKSQFRLYSA